MRVAPVGLFLEPEQAFEVAVDCAALTHGHPSGYLSAGALAFIIATLVKGHNLRQAVAGVIANLKKHEGSLECCEALANAVAFAASDLNPDAAISSLGEGWVGEETLAIAVYAALKFPNDFEQALIVAVNHDGDSDSTGAIVGNILGTSLGIGQVPTMWIEQVELSGVILQVADDLLVRYQGGQAWRDRYPGH